MCNRKGAFTLIELLVVIAIIAILAAILFPVFAQAKAAAKATQSLSNVKQIGTGQQMYIADYDDVMPMRRFCLAGTSPRTVYSWKQAMHPYTKNTDIFTDPVNPAGKFLDDTSDDAILAVQGNRLTSDSKLPRFGRGYAMANMAFYVVGRWDGNACDPATNQNTFTPSQIEAPASVASLWEHKRDWVDTGSYIDWTKNYPDPDGVQRGQGWSWGGGKWSEKAMTLVFHDSHAKRTAHSSICGTPADQVNAFGWVRNNLTNMAPGGDMGWLDTYCQTMPQEVK